MKTLFSLSSVVFALIGIVPGQRPALTYNLPELHVVKQAHLSPAYSCRSSEESRSGYGQTALFFIDRDKTNSPELLFNGACGSEDSFDVALAGDHMSLIADLGADVDLNEVTTHKAFNLRATSNSYSKFTRSAAVVSNHTYVVLINKSHTRGLFVFTVTDHVPNKSVDLKYTVKMYQVLDQVAQAPGFDWEK